MTNTGPSPAKSRPGRGMRDDTWPTFSACLLGTLLWQLQDGCGWLLAWYAHGWLYSVWHCSPLYVFGVQQLIINNAQPLAASGAMRVIAGKAAPISYPWGRGRWGGAWDAWRGRVAWTLGRKQELSVPACLLPLSPSPLPVQPGFETIW